MTTLRLILADQLSHTIAALEGIDKTKDVVMLCEVIEEAEYVPHHPKKIAFLFSCMRHFALELTAQGMNVIYVKLDDPANTGSFDSEIQRIAASNKITKIIVTEPGEYRVLEKFKQWQLTLNVDIREDKRFLSSIQEFRDFVGEKKQLRMEFFYRQMRKKYHILMEPNGTPVGGNWNFDQENRKPPKPNMTFSTRIAHVIDEIDQEVLNLVAEKFSNNFGDLMPFYFATNRAGAMAQARHFIENILPYFGQYQDAMVSGEAFLYHSVLSIYLNAGLLLPLELCHMAQEAYHKCAAPLNAVEGFIRQILGWREFIRGIYWQFMPQYAKLNYLEAHNKLPSMYWGGETKMHCMGQAISHTKKYAYSHHIQRLMITGNFALLANLSTTEVCSWYLSVYADAYEWVELPNTLGMALFGDGGVVASKPYAASGKYINRMSNYCKKCAYDPEQTTGDDACPFNSLYWNFLVKHQKHFRKNQRMSMMYSTWDKFAEQKKSDILAKASMVLSKINEL